MLQARVRVGSLYPPPVATVVTVMDRPGWAARTDNIVIVDPVAERLLWVPRDLWCASIQNRVNTAFAEAGHRGLIDALAEHGLVVQNSLCLCRDAVEYALADVEVTVPVEREQTYWYPLDPHGRVQDGRKVIRFRPPAETLRGERLHQWIGARKGVGWSSTDFDRIGRQQTLLRCLWDDFHFERVVENPDWVSTSSPEAYDDLRRARPSWQFDTFSNVYPRTIAGMAVLVNRQRVSRARRLSWWLGAWLKALRRRARLPRRASS